MKSSIINLCLVLCFYPLSSSLHLGYMCCCSLITDSSLTKSLQSRGPPYYNKNHVLSLQYVSVHLPFHVWKSLLQPEMKLNDPDLPLTRGRQMTAEQTGIWSCNTLPYFLLAKETDTNTFFVALAYFCLIKKTNFLTEAHVAGIGNCSQITVQHPTPSKLSLIVATGR